jgi:hypothetical protein
LGLVVEGEIEDIGGGQLEYGDSDESTLLNQNKIELTDGKEDDQQQ